MRSLLRHRPWLLAAMAASATLPGAVLHVFGAQQVQVEGIIHFAFVAAAAATAAGASIGLTVLGVRRGDARTVLLSTAFSTMTVLLMLHGLATPGVLVGMNGLVALAGAMSLPVGGALLALSAVPTLRRPRSVRRVLVLQGALAVVVGGAGIAGLLIPSLLPSLPKSGSPAAIALMLAGMGFYGVLVQRALRTFALTRRSSDLLVAVGCVWLGVALYPQLMTSYMTFGFYFGHTIELLGIALVGIPAFLDLRRCGASRPLLGDLSAAEIVLREESYLGPRVRALMVSLAAKDSSTERHTRRVALLAVRVGEQLDLPPATLRHLAVGGMLHDIGKLSVPEAVLTKPGALSDAEFAEIKKHPAAGVALLGELGGFSDVVKRVVAEHHERLDGSGYPHGLGSARLGIESRILAVCDVYDALTSDRVYRDAWTIEQALDLLRSEAGTKLDGAVVHALERALGAARAGGAPSRAAATSRALAPA